MTDRDLFLETASSIGRRIAARAVWSGGACTWMVTLTGREHPDAPRVLRLPAEGGVYRGTGGIALFLTELHRLAPDRGVRRAAEGAVAHALAHPGSPRTAYGFHAGRVGTAYAAARAGEVFGRADLLEAAAGVLRELAGGDTREGALDVIAGAAGGIPVLLGMAGALERALCTGIAAALGETLLASAQVEPGGWAWGERMQGVNARHLCGMAHGAAGMGHALMELYAATGDARFRYGAGQAFAYERQFFDPAERNWRDNRHPAGDPGAPDHPGFTSAWCHGAPGIALARLRAWEVAGSAIYRREAESALASTLRALEEGMEARSHGLCHGLSGLGAVLLHGARVLGRGELRRAAERLGVWGAERYERAGVHWPCGPARGERDPGLMLGEAGIGYFHLQLAAGDTPSVLLPSAPGPPMEEDPRSRSAAAALRRADAEAYFARTLRLLRARAPAADPLPAAEACELRGTAGATAEALRRRIGAGPGGRLAEAFRLERTRFEMTREINDFREDYLRAAGEAGEAPVAWEAAEFRLGPEVRVVESGWDPDADPAAADGEAAEPPGGGAVHLLYRARNQVHVRRLGPLAALVLRELEREPATAAALTARVAGALPDTLHPGLGERVRAQLRHLHRGGLVECSRAAVAA